MDAQSIAKIAELATAGKTVEADGRTFLLLANGAVKEIEPFFKPLPDFIQQSVIFNNEASFMAYLGTFGTGETRIFLDKSAHTFTAVIDYHQPERIATETLGGTLAYPGYKSHVARFFLQHTKDWEDWNDISGCTIAQREFAEFLEDHLRNVVSPDGATMMTIAKSLQVKRNVNFVSEQRLGDGTVHSTYQEEDDTRAGKGTIMLPEEINLGIVVFEGADTADEVKAKFRYRLQDGRLGFVVKLMNTEDVINQALDAVVASIQADTEYQVWHGRLSDL